MIPVYGRCVPSKKPATRKSLTTEQCIATLYKLMKKYCATTVVAACAFSNATNNDRLGSATNIRARKCNYADPSTEGDGKVEVYDPPGSESTEEKPGLHLRSKQSLDGLSLTSSLTNYSFAHFAKILNAMSFICEYGTPSKELRFSTTMEASESFTSAGFRVRC